MNRPRNAFPVISASHRQPRRHHPPRLRGDRCVRRAWHFEKALARSGASKIRFHDLRHTHATLALTAGVHLKVVQERLGHSSIAITLDLYSHVVPGMQREAAAKVSAAMFG